MLQFVTIALPTVDTNNLCQSITALENFNLQSSLHMIFYVIRVLQRIQLDSIRVFC